MKTNLFRLILVAAAALLLSGCGTFDVSDLPDIPWDDFPPEDTGGTVDDGGGAVVPPENTNAVPAIPAASILSPEGHRASFLWDNAATRTLNYTSPHFTDAQFSALLDRCVANGDNCIYLYSTQNEGDGAGAGYSIYSPAGDIGGKLDQSAIARIRHRMEMARARGLRIVAFLRADDSPNYNRMRLTLSALHLASRPVGKFNAAAPDRQMNMQYDSVQAFDDLVDLWVMGIEWDEYQRDSNLQQAYVQHMQAITEKPVAVHYTTGDKTSLALKTGADAYLIQYGFSSSPAACAALTKTVIKNLSGRMVAIGGEYDKNSGSSGAKAKAAAILAAGAQGTGNGR